LTVIRRFDWRIGSIWAACTTSDGLRDSGRASGGRPTASGGAGQRSSPAMLELEFPGTKLDSI
jgi:hypothetical protein